MHMKKRRLPRLLIISVILLALLTVSALAYLSASTGGLTNTFSAAPDSEPTIDESFVDNVKTDVKVDVGTPGYAVYVRAAIVVNWEKDGDGNENHFHATAPKLDTDYTLNLNDTDWFKKDGFYYHKAMVNSGVTSPLINSCEVVAGKAPTGYHLSVEIIAQTIQALGTTDNDVNGNPVAVGIPAVEDAWKVVTVDNNGSLIPITP